MKDTSNRRFSRQHVLVLCLTATLAGLLSLLSARGSAAQATPTAALTVSPAPTATVPSTTPTRQAPTVATGTATATGTASATSTSTATRPTATETSVPTETPAPTNTVAPTETVAPSSTPSRTPTATITVVLAELVPTATPNLSSEQEQIGTITVLIFLGIVVTIIVFAVRWMVRAARRDPGEA